MGKGLMVGIFAGAAIGSIITLLFAPKSGKKFRKYIIYKSQNFIDDADKYIATAKKDASQLIKDVKKKSELLVADAEVKLDSLLDESEKILNNTKDRLEDYMHIGNVKLEKDSGRLKSSIKELINDIKSDRKHDRS